MHELGITRNIVDIVSKAAEGRRVLRVQLKIGELSAIYPDSIAFCFDVCCKNTVLEGAKLDIMMIAGCLRCRQCHTETTSKTLYGQCVCGSKDLQCIAGQELLIGDIELD
ncbi:hydrogenase maturation nickel metallochaperone HypA/HybF [Zhongshania arctica]|uniref:Hydrogenase maturation factor HypA n=1 Tax=Zhongshania arctica TaxID=3238302 RepID=A0ABV3TXX9_9GAMM